ncbi:NPCBM/NEW2 domain-containing protein [Candidatus Parcubacteria bacterium]|nr:NPCBM/NEW2 domain-containing protein [Candidatus Parcubacteria bacterium]
MKKRFSKKQLILFVGAILGAFIVRFLLIHLPGYERDIFWFKEWCFGAVNYGVTGIYANMWSDYPPGYFYILKLISSVYKIFYPTLLEGTYFLQFLLKLPAILADLGTATLIFFLIKEKYNFKIAYLALLAYAFNPAIFINSAWWGQVDSIMVFVLLFSVSLLLKKKIKWSYILLAIACLIKIQAIIFIPLILFITWRQKGLKAVIQGISSAMATVFVVLLPFIIKGNLQSVINVYLGAANSYPFASMHAHNLWWLITNAQGTSISDQMNLLGLGTYKTIGFFLFFLCYAILLVYFRKKDWNKHRQDFYFGFAFLALCFFILFTQMHERYIFPFFAFMILAFKNGYAKKVAYVIISLISVGTLLSSLSIAYPENTPTVAQFFELSPIITIIFSIINLIIFIYLLIIVLKNINKKTLLIILGIVMIITGGTYLKNKHSRLDLTELSPIKSSQDWGTLHINKSVENNRLIVDKFIYFKGLGVHSNSEHQYHLNKKFKYFETDFGLDNESFCNNNARFIILGDNKILYDSGIIKHQSPKHIKVLVKDINILSLITQDGGDGIDCDHTDWLNPVLIP